MFANDVVDCLVHNEQQGFTAHDLEQLLSIFDSQTGSPNSNSGSDEGSTRSVYNVDERKERRMKSNRESARRSRWRKKRHLENLTEQAKKLKVENEELKYMLGSTLSQCHVVRSENQRLFSESVALRGRLTHLCHALLAMHDHAVINNGRL
ncbi:bZIP transcription factor 44 [Linum perenne]